MRKTLLFSTFYFFFIFLLNDRLLLSVLEYQTAVMRRDFETADRVLPTIPAQHRSRVAHFLEKQVLINTTQYYSINFIFLKFLIQFVLHSLNFSLLSSSLQLTTR